MSKNDVIRRYVSRGASTTEELYSMYEQFLRDAKCSWARNTYKRKCREILNKHLMQQAKVINREVAEDGTITTRGYSHQRLSTAEDMAKHCDISLDEYFPATITTNEWGNDDNPCWQFKILWKPIFNPKTINPKDAGEIFKNIIEKHETPKFSRSPQGDEITVEIQIPDLHFGQQSWGDETGGGHYDIRTSQREYLKAVEFFCSRYADMSVQKFILPTGNDFFNVNNAMNTTVNNTLQDEDTRIKKTFMIAMDTLIDAVYMLSTIAPVEVVQIPGNHDSEQVFFLMAGLSKYFRNSKDVFIDMSPSDRKYIKVGDTLLGLAHGKVKGKAIQMRDLPLIMADEAPVLWSHTKYREFHIGHLHKQKTLSWGMSDEFRGVVVRVCPTLAQIDYWHSSSGYRGTRCALAFEYEKGLRSIQYYYAD